MFNWFLKPPSNKESRKNDLGQRLHDASTEGALEAAKEALCQGADVNWKTSNEATPLMAAALNGKDSIVELLLSGGSDLGARDDLGDSALHCACVNGSPNTVRLLLEAGANPTACDKKGWPPFFNTLVLENVAVMRWWLANGATTEVRDDSGATVAWLAAALGRLRLLQVLIESGADIEARNLKGETPFIASLSNAQSETAGCLEARGSDIHAVDGTGAGALHHAAWGGMVRFCERLIGLGFDPNNRDSKLRTPLHIAVARGFPTIHRILVEAGGDLTLKDEEGRDVLELANEARGLRRLNEEIRLIRALPDTISAHDFLRLYPLFDKMAAIDDDIKEPVWHELRALLEDLVHAYELDPGRAGSKTVSISRVLERVDNVAAEVF